MIMVNCLSVFCDAQEASTAARGRLRGDACASHRQMPMELELMETSPTPPPSAPAALLLWNAVDRSGPKTPHVAKSMRDPTDENDPYSSIPTPPTEHQR